MHSSLESDFDQSRPLIDQTLAVNEDDYGDESALLNENSIEVEDSSQIDLKKSEIKQLD